MDALLERHALTGATLPPVPGRLAIAPAPDCGRIALRARHEDRPAVAGALGLALPAEIGELASGGGVTAICLGPDEWYLLVEQERVDDVAARLRPLERRCSIVDVSHREVGIEVRGSAAALALRSFCTLDLDAMADNSATRTLLDRAAATLVRHDAEHYRIEVWNSFATHVWGLLARARGEIELDI